MATLFGQSSVALAMSSAVAVGNSGITCCESNLTVFLALVVAKTFTLRLHARKLACGMSSDSFLQSNSPRTRRGLPKVCNCALSAANSASVGGSTMSMVRNMKPCPNCLADIEKTGGCTLLLPRVLGGDKLSLQATT